MKLTYAQIQQNVANLANRQGYTADFLYELLAAYGRSASSITQLRQGMLNKAEEANAVLQKDVVYFKVFPRGTILEDEIDNIENDPLTQRFRPRYLITSDLNELRAKDTKKNTTLALKIADIDKDVAFFYGWTGDEKVDEKTEAVADRRVAEKMNQLYTEIEKVNAEKFVKEGNAFRHDLNVFFTRLLFCFFADDTGLFKKNQFAEALKNVTNLDGSDMNAFFVYLFKALDSKDKAGLSTPFSDFPYVNGSIFNTGKHAIVIPNFNAQARHLLLECAKSNWGDINPDIFGTMFQGIVDPDKRDQSGMDYTSVPNIMKVIEPLFLDGLRDRFDEIYNSPNQLRELLVRVRGIKIFDPACGSGNFLIITYKQLRLLENAILSRLDELKSGRRSKKRAGAVAMFESGEVTGENSQIYSSEISLNNFFGIEIDDLAHELAILSLYLAKHQMDAEFERQFPVKLPHLPLIENKNIVKDNAARVDWNTVCPNNGTDEIYLIGNPPYKGADKQTEDQKLDFEAYFSDEDYSGNLDYISIWFIKGARYIARTKARLALVSTNSVTQGEHVGIMFPKIFGAGVEIGFAYTSFKWKNSARDQAGVAVVIVSLRPASIDKKYLYVDDIRSEVPHISAYLLPSDTDIIYKTNRILSDIPEMVFGSMPRTKLLVLSPEERVNFLNEAPQAEEFIKKYLGAEEYINGVDRYCIWVEDEDYDRAKLIPALKKRFDEVATDRLKSKAKSTRKFAGKPYRFVQISYKPTDSIIVPGVSTERREYIPMGFLDEGTVISNAANAIYDAEPWLFALLESKMHMAWIRTVCGQLETRIRYSSTLGYNTYPVPPLTDVQKGKLKASALKILQTRENHSEKTLAQMYDPDTMPDDLRAAHHENDVLVDGLYRQRGFANDEDRLATLFDMYAQMTRDRALK